MEKARTDNLLYQLLPKSVAEKLRSGDAVLSTCEVNELYNSEGRTIFGGVRATKIVTLIVSPKDSSLVTPNFVDI